MGLINTVSGYFSNGQTNNKRERSNSKDDADISNSASNIKNDNIQKDKNEEENDKENNNILNKTMVQADFENLNLVKLKPNKCILFNQINIFNSILIMLSNIDPIKKYMKQKKFKITIDECNKTSKNNLSNIFYSLFKCLWNIDDDPAINEKDLLNEYNKYLKLKINGVPPDKFCNDINNLKNMINFVYFNINKELTTEKQKMLIKKKDEKTKEYINSINQNTPFGYYLVNAYIKSNLSIISDKLIGFTEEKIICKNCKDLNTKPGKDINENDFTFFKYDSFPFLEFNINEINMNITNNNMANNNSNMTNMFANHNHYIDLINCFDYITIKEKKSYMAPCQRCKMKNSLHEREKAIYSFPVILTLILNITDNYNFFYLNELDLKDYALNKTGAEEYKLISILCQLIYNKKFLCYCINTDDGSWYSYSDNKEIKKVTGMDDNAIPLIVIYQSSKTINYKYNTLERNSFEKFCLNIKIPQRNPIKYIFPKEKSIKLVREKIAEIANVKTEHLTLLFNGEKVKNEQKLSEVIKEATDVAEFTAYIN